MARRVDALPLNEVHAAALVGFVPYAARELEVLGERYGRRGQEFAKALLAGILVQADRMVCDPFSKDPSNIGIEGPPGAGKTTIIRTAARALKRAFASYAEDYPDVSSLWPTLYYGEIKGENLGVSTLEPIPVVDENGETYNLIPLKIIKSANRAFLAFFFIDDFNRGLQFSFDAKQGFSDAHIFLTRIYAPMVLSAAWNTNKDTDNANPIPQAVLNRFIIILRWGHVSVEEFAQHSAYVVGTVASAWKRLSREFG